jgi:transcriptional regulator with XRE-family HTH domain
MLYNKKETLSHWQNIAVEPGNTTGSRVRRARIANKMTIADLAKASGLTSFTISSVEHDRVNPSLQTLKSLSSALGVSASSLAAFDQLPEKTFGERVKKARLISCMTKEQYAAHIGVNQRTVGDWESGKRMPRKSESEIISFISNKK